MSTMSGENENQIAYQELTIWGSWLLLPSPLPDISSLPQMMWYWVLVSLCHPFQICFYATCKNISSGFIFSENVSSFPSGFLGPLQATALCLVCPSIVPPPSPLPSSAPLNVNAGPRNKERRPRGKRVSLRLARYPSRMWRGRVSGYVWLGQERRPLNILLSVLHKAGSTTLHADTWRGWKGWRSRALLLCWTEVDLVA